MNTRIKFTPVALALLAMGASSVWAGEDGGDGRGGDRHHRAPPPPPTYASATVTDTQNNVANVGVNDELKNKASLSGGSLSGASGNIGVNIGAGDNNQQANAAALSAADASFVFDHATASASASQYNASNLTTNAGVTNSATLEGGSLSGASGNIGVNITAGNNNQQKNDLTASVANAKNTSASVSANQNSTSNTTTNSPVRIYQTTYETVTLRGGMSGDYQGSTVAWEPSSGRGDDHGRGGTEYGYEAGDIALAGCFTANIPVQTLSVNKLTTNTATLGGGSLQGASGNIGVNISAGTGNQQFNGLSIVAASATVK